MSCNPIVAVNQHFQASVHLEYDLLNFDKMKEYIPTTDACNILKFYIKNVLWEEKNKATIFVGPYGKGKSFLLLMLLQIIGCDNPYLDVLLNRIKEVDMELYERIQLLKQSNKKLLPIVIDSNYYDVNQSFLLALQDALQLAGLDDIIPETVYGICLELLNDWENHQSMKKLIIHACMELNGITLSELRRELTAFDRKGYHHFETLYNHVTTGLKFHPMLNTDIVKTYSNILYQLQKYGYSGIFIVYDEFSKTLEDNNEYLSKNLKIIQDLAEKANRSNKEQQMHLCCVTHKSISLYGEKNYSIHNSFKTVEGRFKEIYFTRNLDQNYQILTSSIRRLEGFNESYERFYRENIKFYEAIISFHMFDKMDDTLLKNCFPFNPIAIYAIVQLSEIVSQNERTMFTLIADNDPHSFSTFIQNNNQGLYNLDKVYDYFCEAFSSSEETYCIWNKAKSALKKVKNKIGRKMIKALACIKIINDFSKLAPTIKYITHALHLKYEYTETIISELVEAKILKVSFDNHYIDFSFTNMKEIDEAVDHLLVRKANMINVTEILEEIYPEKYFLPREYNFKFKMTRYFISKFITEAEFLRISSFSPYLENKVCDGIVFHIIDCKCSKEEIIKKFKKIKDNRNVIIRVSIFDKKSCYEQASYIYALKLIEKDDKFDELTRNQAKLLYNEKEKELTNVLTNILNKKHTHVIANMETDTISNLCSKICHLEYPCTPDINVEMLNKNIVSTAYKKARNNVITSILRKEDMKSLYTDTSPEMTIYNAYYSTNGKLAEASLKIVNIIKSYMRKEHDGKVPVESLIHKLKNKPYGIREGLLPIFLSIAIANMKDNTILYFEHAELEINALNITKMCEQKIGYYFIVEKQSVEQELYLESLIRVFHEEPTESYYMNTKIASSLIKKWVINLPIILKELTNKNNYLNVDIEFIAIKDEFLKFDVNDYEVVIKKIPSICKENYRNVIDFFMNRKNIFLAIDRYTIALSKKIKQIFIETNYCGSLNSCFKDWFTLKHIDVSKIIVSTQEKELLNTLLTLSFDEIEATNQIVRSVLKYRINDWSDDHELKFLNELVEFKKRIENYTDTVCGQNLDIQIKSMEITPLGKSLKNNIESIIDEYNDSISSEEKAFILIEILKQFVGGQ